MEYAKAGETIFRKLDNAAGLAETYDVYGLLYERAHEPELARKAYEEAIQYCDQGPENMSEKKFDIYMGLAGMDICSIDEALQYVEKAENLIIELPEEEKNKAKIKIYHSFGNGYYKQKKYALAIENYEKAIKIWLNNGGEEQSYIIAKCYDLCGYSYIADGNYDKAVEYIKRSLKILEQLEEIKIWDYAIAYRHLSVIYTAADIEDYDQAMEYGVKSCQLYTKEKELNNEELEELKMMKAGLQSLYERSPLAEKQDFEVWYQEEIKQ